METLVRLARPGDAGGIAQVHVQSWAETYRGLISDEALAARTSYQARQRRETIWRSVIPNPEQVV